MLTIWSTVPLNKVQKCLSGVLCNYPSIEVFVSKEFNVPSQTQIILALGQQALQKLQSLQIVHKNRTITSLRTQPVYIGKIPVLVSYSPDIGEVDHRYHVDLLTDVGLAVRYAQTGSFKPKSGKYNWVLDFYTTIERIKFKYEQTQTPIEVMLDLETLGLDPYALPTINHPGAYVVTIQVCHEIGEAVAVRFGSRLEEESFFKYDYVWKQIEWLLNSPMVSLRGANLKFDLNWLWVRGKFRCINFKFDTTIVGSLLDENRSNALDVHVKLYALRGGGYSDYFDRHAKKDRMDLELKKDPEGFLNYACGDVDYGLEVAQNQKKELLKDPQLTRFYVNILHPASRAFECIEQGGIFADPEANKELKLDLEKEQHRILGLAKPILGGRLVAKHLDTTKVGGLNLTKASLLEDFLFSPMGLNLKPKMLTAKEKKPSTAMEHLEMFEDDHNAGEFIKLLGEYSEVKTTYNNYVISFWEHLRSDGRFHPTYFLFAGAKDDGEGGTNTGRLSTHDPPFQTLPEHTKWAKRIRRCFPAPPGYVVLARDLQQGELRVVACVANEDSMISAYKAKQDLHALTGGAFLGLNYEQMMQLKVSDKEKYSVARQAAKPANFGLLYGQMAEGFKNYARRNYKVEMTLEEATDRRDLFFKRYPKLLKYHSDYKEFAKKNGYVRHPLGRVRHLPLMGSPSRQVSSKEERRSVNSPIQGCLSDMLLWSIAIEWQTGLTEVSPSFGACHDAAYNYVLEDRITIEVPKLMGVLENLPFETVGWKPQLSFPADAKIGKTMGDIESFVLQ